MTIPARCIMSKEVVTVSPEATVLETARRLVARGISAVAVVDGDGRPVGVVSEGDLMRLFGKEFQSRRAQWLRMLAEGETLAPDFLAAIGVDQRHVRDLVRLPIISAGEQTSVADLVDLMLEHSIKRVLILREGKLVGVVSRTDVLRTVLEHVESLLEPID
ncbi:MAG: CBS domain-containing protein [Microvirga sp.]